MKRILNKFSNKNYKHYDKLKNLSKYKNNKKINIDNKKIQGGFTNFYHLNTIQPYLPIKAAGPWILTNEEKLVYDTGGYGMLGLGHNPEELKSILNKEQVMANIMTPNIAQHNFHNKIKEFIEPAYQSIMCLNSGSEANTLAMRIANIHNHKNPVTISMIGSFHGRTEKPSIASHSCRPNYQKYLADYMYQNVKPNYFIKYNDVESAIEVFDKIKKNNQFPEITLLEPVQGEGNPGVMVDPNFYKVVRELTQDQNGLLLVDSVQAGLRCTGELSMTKYPGFENLDSPDMETFSKAINAGQFPLSVLAVNQKVKDRFIPGIYGNTMTCNPRALDIGTQVLNLIDNDLKNNIVSMGKKLKQEFQKLEEKYDFITGVTGTGLLLAIHLDNRIPVLEIERNLRINGLNAIHGGENALRFTPWFYLSELEINYIIELLEKQFNLISDNHI